MTKKISGGWFWNSNNSNKQQDGEAANPSQQPNSITSYFTLPSFFKSKPPATEPPTNTITQSIPSDSSNEPNKTGGKRKTKKSKRSKKLKKSKTNKSKK